ncbi:GntR family transcriptional regulator [Nocardiopsis sp. NPDC006938]|uniref:GntR family transcriptional regulator n=1 Tax=Nocardiopsis sp. NPDC006938 TaxID=3364337 RepID=UPI0036A74ABB
MDNDTTDARPMQVRIADDLRNQINRGNLAPGEKLPTLAALASQHGVSEMVARRAVELLRQEGAVISRKGSGTFVREAVPIRRHGLQRYSRSVWGGKSPKPLLKAEGERQGKGVGQESSTEQTSAPKFVVDRLPDVNEGDLVYTRRRITKLDGVINQSADSYFSLNTGERSPAIVAGEGPGGHIARINALSPVLEIQEEITTRMPSGPEASRLQIPTGTPVFDVIRTYHCEDGPMDVTKFVIRGDMAAFDYQFPVPE